MKMHRGACNGKSEWRLQHSVRKLYFIARKLPGEQISLLGGGKDCIS